MSKILLVDDDTTLLRAVARNLEHAGHEVIKALGGDEALLILRERKPDLILSDKNMGDLMGGIELAAWVRNLYPHQKMILWTGDDVDDLANRTGFPCYAKGGVSVAELVKGHVG